MTTTTTSPVVDRLSTARAQRVGRVLTGLAIAFLTFDAVGKLLRLQAHVDGTVDLGFTSDHVRTIGVLLAVGIVLHLVPRTAFLGALVITAFLGGAVCANLRLDLPLASHVLSPVYVAVVLWAGYALRSARVRALVTGR